jgi:UDP-N-acetylglucosamine 2-epimerase (non-hydrolysing)/GDP/UDP-N,N'-diacetylbacillosamine 2-epimerase (hydrolysing)
VARGTWSVEKKLDLLVVTSSRADYGHLYWPLRAFEKSRLLKPRLVVMGPHLSADFGATASIIEADGFTIAAQVSCLEDDDTDRGMALTIGQAMAGFAEVFDQLRPDLVLLIADRYEMLAPASAALALRIPIAHIEGGEISEGAIDNAVRNALTMMSHIHFTSTVKARARVIGMGEEPWRVHHVGAPSLDHHNRSDLLDRRQIEAELGLDLKRSTLLVAYHPVTLDKDTTAESLSVLAALDRAIDEFNVQLVICHPNADAGGRWIAERMRALCQRYSNSARFIVNLEPRAYWSLLRQVDLLVGNSSSGVMEAGSIPVGAVDIGWRQRGRERGGNVISVPGDEEAIVAGMRRGLSEPFRTSLQGMTNVYGDGRSAERITSVLEELPATDRLLEKRYQR